MGGPRFSTKELYAMLHCYLRSFGILIIYDKNSLTRLIERLATQNGQLVASSSNTPILLLVSLILIMLLAKLKNVPPTLS